MRGPVRFGSMTALEGFLKACIGLKAVRSSVLLYGRLAHLVASFLFLP